MRSFFFFQLQYGNKHQQLFNMRTREMTVESLVQNASIGGAQNAILHNKTDEEKKKTSPINKNWKQFN